MKTLFRKTILFALVAALGVAAAPFVNASAAGAYDPTPPPQGGVSNERLERVWARQLRIYERHGQGFERDDAFTGRVQGLIDRAEANGKDASAIQAALDAFEAASQHAQPIYESAESIVTSHQGFDETGKVTDSEQAQETIQAMRQKFEEIKNAMNGTRKALHEAIRAFREANPRPQSTPTATSG
jgi:hypothetical protein